MNSPKILNGILCELNHLLRIECNKGMEGVMGKKVEAWLSTYLLVQPMSPMIGYYKPSISCDWSSVISYGMHSVTTVFNVIFSPEGSKGGGGLYILDNSSLACSLTQSQLDLALLVNLRQILISW